MSVQTDRNNFIIFIYTSLPGYMFNCIEKLATEIDYKIILIETDTNINYLERFSSRNFDIVNFSDFNALMSKIDNRNILKIFVTGWANKRTISLTNYFYRQKKKLILFSDQPKKNNIKQIFGKVLLKRYLNKFEKIIVPGKAGYELMVYYGVPKMKISTGLYSANDSIFNESKKIRDTKNEYPKRFLFDGQFIKRKGLPFLINEYLEYLKISKDPWKLTMVGKGELENIIPKEIENLGFIKQIDLKAVYANAGCFVLPSYEDHWGVVVHQATCSGLPLLISPYCSSHHELFRENLNGYFVDPNYKGSLTKAMFMIESLSLAEIKKMGELSFKLSKSFSTEKWVNNIKNIISE